MAFQRKSNSAATIATAEYPRDLPPLDRAIVERFPELARWKESLDKWWFDFRTVLQRQAQSSQTEVSSETADFKAQTVKEIGFLSQQINQLSSSLAGLSSQMQIVAGLAGNASVAALMQAVENLASHVAATSAHGLTGDIVGTSDKQELDNKTIGKNAPGYGRFSVLITKSIIGSEEVISIPQQNHTIVAGEFEVHGILEIAGTFCFL